MVTYFNPLFVFSSGWKNGSLFDYIINRLLNSKLPRSLIPYSKPARSG
jgi:hypothetical protein